MSSRATPDCTVIMERLWPMTSCSSRATARRSSLARRRRSCSRASASCSACRRRSAAAARRARTPSPTATTSSQASDPATDDHAAGAKYQLSSQVAARRP
ncbi:hypothetical protein [Quadrisphaera oryzae]|uniref:hypothetical protein n=2 Tax=Quadrisphaera TaxID=317661 RepID=UPI001C96548E|nr:hypothetical protein [Quadrisphaera sp. RL12-1S]